MRCNFNRRSALETCVRAKFVPRLLTDDQREQRQTIARDLYERSYEDVQFLKNTVTGDDSRVYGYDPETKQQSSQWKGPTSPRPKKGRQVRTKQRSCYWRFLILRVSYTTSTLLTGKLLTRNSTWRSCGVCVNQSPKTTGKMAGWRLGSAPRQCARTHFTSCAAVFGQTRHRSVAAAAILTRSRTV